MSLKCYKYRIYPTKNQRIRLNSILDECRWLYNYFLEQRRDAWDKEKKSLSHYDQMNLLPGMKKQHTSLTYVYAQTLQEVATRLDLAFQAFFRRCKAGETPGYPRFKSADRYNSFTFPQTDCGFMLTCNHKIKLSKVGCIKIKLHRKPPAIIKTCTVKRMSTGKWFVFLVGEVEPAVPPISTSTVAIDIGIKTFATMSDSSKIENPKFFKQSEEKLACAQRKLAKQKVGTEKRARAKLAAARVYEKMKNQRHDFAHQHSRALVNKYSTIFIENIETNKFINPGQLRVFNRAQRDVAWSQFFTFLLYKAEDAGRVVVKVNPAYTSQDCSSCHTRKLMPLEQRVYHCDVCGLELDRDYNAALNILRLGTQSLASSLNNARA